MKTFKENTFFMSDPHFYHANVIKYSNRPFPNVDEMNETMIQNINKKVGENDTLFILGDFTFGNPNQAILVLSRINCKNKFYIFGNHDKPMFDSKIKQFFIEMTNYKEIYIEDLSLEFKKQHICLMHYPILEWNKAHRGSWMLHGHCHGNLKIPKELEKARITDVGVDCWNYTPVSYQELKEKFKNCKDIVHHGD